MEDRSALVISFYEEEKQRLELLTKQCLEDEFEGPDYIAAHHHQQALFTINRTLETLYSLNDKYYSEKQSCERFIKYFQKQLEVADAKNLEDYLEAQLLHYKDKLESLTLKSKVAQNTSDSKIFDNTLTELINKKIKKFKIVFNQSENIWLQFSNRGSIIKIVSSVMKRVNLHYSERNLLEKLGFTLNKRNQFVFLLDNSNEDVYQKIQYLMVRIVFDVSIFKPSSHGGFIEF